MSFSSQLENGKASHKNLNKTIMNVIQTPFNVHVLNIVNTIQTLDKYKKETTQDVVVIDKKCIGNIIIALHEIKLNEKLHESVSFEKIVENIETLLKQSIKIHNKRIPSQVFITLESLTKVFKAFSKNNAHYLDTSIEELEDNLDAMENDIIKQDLVKSYNDKVVGEKMWKNLVEISASLYGLLAALNIDSKWKDIINDVDIFQQTILQIDDHFFDRTNDTIDARS